jgi:hypothetical protein
MLPLFLADDFGALVTKTLVANDERRELSIRLVKSIVIGQFAGSGLCRLNLVRHGGYDAQKRKTACAS